MNKKMKKKIRLAGLLLCIFVFASGCLGNKEMEMTEKEEDLKEEERKEETEMKADSFAMFPEQYDAVSESGKVRFHCFVEVPENEIGKTVYETSVTGKRRCDRKTAWNLYSEGKEVDRKHETPADAGREEEDFYIFTDGSFLGTGNGMNYGTDQLKYYTNAGALNADYQERFEQDEVTFKSSQECIEVIKDALEELGYQTQNFIFRSYPLAFDTLKELEEECVIGGYIAEKDRKDSWTQEDDAYVIYAYQINDGIPVFHELMSLSRHMAYDNAGNAPVRAIYSTRGLEEFIAYDQIYDFQTNDTMVSLKPFDEVASVVQDKFESILNDAVYEVTRAKFYTRVYLNEAQQYVAEPVWYFEVIENNSSKSLTLIHAETGKEIFLN